MAENNFGKGIRITSGFDLSAKLPLDNRYIVKTLEERDAHVTNNRAYEGMSVYVLDEKKVYIYNGTEWTEQGGISDEQLEQLTIAYQHSQSKHVTIEDLHNHDNKSVLDGITSDKVTEWNNKSEFDGNYNNLTNKPIIPTKTSELTNDSSLATETYVNNQIANGSTTAISVNGQLYTHSNGIITLPNYPTGGSTDTPEELPLVASYEFEVTDPTGLYVDNIFDGALTIEGGKPYTYKLLSNDMQLVTEFLFAIGGCHTDDSRVDGEIYFGGLDIPEVYTSPTGIVDFYLWIEGVTGNFTLQIFEGKAQTYVCNSGASFVVFGDSYSTYEGWMPETHAIYYPAEDVADVKQTWWWQVANETKMSLMLNDSWSGSTICGTGYEGEDCLYTNSFVNRVATFCDGVRLSNKPNLVFIFGGTNDAWCESPVGSVKYDDFTTEDLYYVLPAFCSIVDYIQTYIPGCRIINIVNGDLLTADIVNGMAQACKHYGIDNVVLSDISMSNGHPTITGMLQIKNKILEILGTDSTGTINADKVGGLSIWSGTQAEYDAIEWKDDHTLYLIRGE